MVSPKSFLREFEVVGSHLFDAAHEIPGARTVYIPEEVAYNPC